MRPVFPSWLWFLLALLIVLISLTVANVIHWN